MRTLLLDPNSLLEFLLNRSNFIGKVEYLSTIFRRNSEIQLYLSQPGLDKIVSLIKPLNGLEKTEQLVTKLKKRIKILRLTQAVAEKAKSSSINYDSAVEIHLAIMKNIDAIVTHQPDNFSSEKLSIITLSDLQLNHLELSLAKNINELPAILVTPVDKILNLNKTFHIPSYIAPKPSKPKKSTRQLNPNYSSNKLSSPTGKNLSPLYIDRDRLLIKSFARSTAHVDFAKLSSLGLESLTYKSSLETLQASIDRNHSSIKSFARSTAQVDIQSAGLITGCRAYTNPVISLKESMLHAGKAYSLLMDGLSIKPLVARSTAQANIQNISDLSIACQAYISPLNGVQESIRQHSKICSSAIDSSSIRSPDHQSFAQLESSRFSGMTATALQTHENLLGSKVMEYIRPLGKASSLAVERLSSKSPDPQSFAQLESPRFSGMAATALQTHENLLGSKVMEYIRPSGKASSLAVERLSIKSPALPSFAQLESSRFSGMTATALQTHENLLGSKVMEYIRPSGKASSLAVERLSIKSPALPSFAQLESTRFGGVAATVLQAHESLLDTLKERIDRSSQLNPLSKVDRSFSDRAGLLSQIELLESMQRANTLDSYLSRKN
jgi:hypothetical protein